MTDAELLGYTEIHCDTPRALFSREHFVQFLRIADENLLAQTIQRDERRWFSLPRDVVQPLLEQCYRIKAQRRLVLVVDNTKPSANQGDYNELS